MRINNWDRIIIPVAMAGLVFAGSLRAGTLYWDTDHLTAGNSSLSGANLGGSGVWSAVVNPSAYIDDDWWEISLSTNHAWIVGSDAVFWGTAGSVSLPTLEVIMVNHITFKTSGYAVTSGTLSLGGVPSHITVDSGVATIGSTIAGTNTIWKLGAGTLILSNTNNLNTATNSAGGWRIEGGGTLVISADTCLGAALPDTARNTVTDIQFNQSTIQAAAPFDLDINRRTKIGTNSSTNQGDAVIDTHGNVVSWYGSLQGGAGSLRIINSGANPGLLRFGTDKKASINPFGSVLPAGTV